MIITSKELGNFLGDYTCLHNNNWTGFIINRYVMRQRFCKIDLGLAGLKILTKKYLNDFGLKRVN